MNNQLGVADKTPQPRRCAWGIHKWTIWSAEKPINVTFYTRAAGSNSTVQLLQERICLRCNKIESRSSV